MDEKQLDIIGEYFLSEVHVVPPGDCDIDIYDKHIHNVAKRVADKLCNPIVRDQNFGPCTLSYWLLIQAFHFGYLH